MNTPRSEWTLGRTLELYLDSRVSSSSEADGDKVYFDTETNHENFRCYGRMKNKLVNYGDRILAYANPKESLTRNPFKHDTIFWA